MRDDELEAARLRAYQIWEREGRPHGQHESHWHKALAELGLVQPYDDDRESLAAQTRRWDESEE